MTMDVDANDGKQRLCDHCSDLSLERLTPYIARLPNEASGSGYVLYESSDALWLSTKDCALCSLIYESLYNALLGSKEVREPISNAQTLLQTGQITIEPKSDPIGKAFPRDCSDGLFLNCLVVKAQQLSNGVSFPIRGKVRLYTDEHEPHDSRSNIIGRPRLMDPSTDVAFSLIRDWLQGCCHQHTLCRETLSGIVIDHGDLPPLPTRVLDVTNEKVVLVHSGGTRARYATLSHCWGPQDRRPLATTKQTLPSFLREVPWQQLPKSFRDAITVARKIGIGWVWIDSLCIVQDDEDDWERESQLMGTIFENAEVTLAACHSTDSWQGFLLPRARQPLPIELPDFLTGQDPVKVMATVRYETVRDTFPEHGILNERAWATQEWLLSRRMVFFTKEALVWSCKEITQRETGERCYNISRNLAWTVVVERYSERKLTFSKDRLVALEGLRRELGKKTGLTYALGIWKEALPNQLLWQVTEHREPSNVLDLPSWAWIHVPCGVRFLLVHKAKSLISNITISDPPRELSFRSWIRDVSVVQAAPPSESKELTEAFNEDLARSNTKSTASLSRCLCDSSGNLLGWVAFDIEEDYNTQDTVTLAALMGGILRRDEETERRTGRVISKKLRHYWVLALKLRDDGTYSRLGVGKTYGREWWQNSALETIVLH